MRETRCCFYRAWTKTGGHVEIRRSEGGESAERPRQGVAKCLRNETQNKEKKITSRRNIAGSEWKHSYIHLSTSLRGRDNVFSRWIQLGWFQESEIGCWAMKLDGFSLLTWLVLARFGHDDDGAMRCDVLSADNKDHFGGRAFSRAAPKLWNALDETKQEAQPVWVNSRRN